MRSFIKNTRKDNDRLIFLSECGYELIFIINKQKQTRRARISEGRFILPKIPIGQRESAILTLKFTYDLGRKRDESISSPNTYFWASFRHNLRNLRVGKGYAHPPSQNTKDSQKPQPEPK